MRKEKGKANVELKEDYFYQLQNVKTHYATVVKINRKLYTQLILGYQNMAEVTQQFYAKQK